MKKSILILTLVLLLLCSLSAPTFAEGEEGLPYYVSDVAGILTETQQQSLNADAERISNAYGCGVYIVTLSDFTDYDRSGNSFWSFSQDFYTRYHLGLGEDWTGILLIMSMAERDYSLLAHGMEAHYAFTDYGKQVLEKSFLDNFRQDDWYGGFKDYIHGCEDLLSRAAAGNPLDVSYQSQGTQRTQMDRGVAVALTVVPSLLIALVVSREGTTVNATATPLSIWVLCVPWL